MQKLHIVLVEPRIPQNTGNISRTCAVTGADLHLIEPFGFTITDKSLKRAGLDYWDKLHITKYANITNFMEQHKGDCIYYCTTKSPNCYTEISFPMDRDVYLMFGREDKGLPEDILFSNQEFCVRIPMLPTLRSLNLSNSVAIMAYEVLRQWSFPNMQYQGELTKYKWE